MANSPSSRCAILILSALTFLIVSGPVARCDDEHFERHIRPVLVNRCFKCHANEMSKGGLKADSRSALLQGGDSGPAIIPGKPQQSRLLFALRYQDGLEMPPDGKLSETQIAEFEKWIAAGAVWPGDDGKPDNPDKRHDDQQPDSDVADPLAPDIDTLRPSLQLWLKADALTLDDGSLVNVWPDLGPRGHDLSATKGVRTGGTGMPGTFVRQSRLMGRPAVRFSTETGLASSPQHRPEIQGDASLSIMLVMNLQPHEAGPPFDGVIGIGNPAFSGNPGRPLAALIQINRGEDHALHFAGGWNHDASLGPGSFRPWYNKAIILTAIKSVGPMRFTTRLFVNGNYLLPPGASLLAGVDSIPDIQHRSDIGMYMGRALGWSGSIQGDVGEVLVYNKAITESEQRGLEAGLAEKYGLMLDGNRSLAAAPKFSSKEKQYWAFQPVRDVSPPEVAEGSWVKTDVDRFTMATMSEHQLRPAPLADKRTLLRRVTFDLTGLPPSPEEMDAFLNDTTPEAFERVVDRLLKSPHYGEHWARHWLDVARYAESTANDANAVMRFAWRYRNYVIDAFNSNMPYDQFVKEQLAGDLMASSTIPEKTRRTIATGFLMVGPKALAETDKEQSRLDIVDDQIDVLGRAMLGMTLSCARCHDHKFDAIRSTDYYALAGIFRSTEPFMDEARNATMWWEYDVPQADGTAPVTVMAPKDSVPRNLRVHLRGNRFTLGKIVPRGAMSVLANVEPSIQCAVDPNQITSGRLELAEWVASPGNPLTARVIVNRVWQQHFGRGLVATSDNFGTRGEPPTHPQLLDWLTFHFVRKGWNLQWLHRQILLSNTWQQSHLRDAIDTRWLSGFTRRRLTAEELRDAMLSVSGQLDRTPGSSESGEFLYSQAEDINSKIRPNRVGADDPFYTEFRKRSIYLPIVRNMVPDVLTLFDAADPNSVTSTRNATTVSLQSLFLMNHPFVRQQSLSFADRLLGMTVSDDVRIHEAHRLALGRPATDVELNETNQFLRDYEVEAMNGGASKMDARRNAWQSFCQALLCSNEFLYVE